MTLAASTDRDMMMPASTVVQMHENYMRNVRNTAARAAQASGQPDVAEHLVKLQIAAARKNVKLDMAALTALAAQGTTAIVTRTWEIDATRFFNDEQQKKLDNAAQIRTRHDVVGAVFDGQPRLYLQTAQSAEAQLLERNVRKHLAHIGYQVTDYVRGYATDAAGKQQFRIGKLLKDKLPFLYDGFAKDTSRMGNTMVVISQDPQDIARMSAGRDWVSCMSPWKTEFNIFAHKDIEHGTLVAYLVSQNDPDAHAPLARVLIKPYTDQHPLLKPAAAPPPLTDLRQLSPLRAVANRLFGKPPPRDTPAPAPAGPQTIFVPEHKVHGLRSDVLYQTALDFVTKHLNGAARDGAYYLSPALYCDSGGSREYAKQGDTLRAIKGFDSNPEAFEL